ncbi:glycosyltransferase family 2 protein [Vibrio parahaemolyticus]|uniref:glycosyltransferase family 2 protein n=2 Tax=Vibrio parahaemolyticus TaxID=670 RepID=UPI0003DBFF22|nr:glycosyltransferase family 2 protein [Vibrio parahaemolyticus]EGQ9466343.1 glycosyltransferase family 2 protein [Vibrio parahaemolyticus]EJB0383869.1 glycosyltransferase family 2 protein [Vibrio parahaemolyticus]EJG0988004.1 glycosyltransferase family 2 protein [Vibrio parahaemolyticus]EJG1069475.1 glycosyltransferase family 2 protein [Vibrio parahaemolyticus]EJG1102394.1 glycosyltransferase family 2 protein [Vibrio parahaemolyticus]
MQDQVRVLEDVVYVFFCYKQSSYLDKTLPAALEQTAWPSQLLVLDDCSPDDSHEKILSLLEFAPKGLNIEYRHNTQNVGLVSQINSLRGQYQNKLIIVQAGDDIAMPNRVEETYETWLKNGKPSLIIGSYDKISEQGDIIEPFESIKQNKKPYTLENIINRKCAVDGCCAAFTSDVLNEFEPYNIDIINEDRINVLRAFLLNGIHHEHKKWIQYRLGGISTFAKETREEKYNNTVINAQRELQDLKMNLRDAQSKNANEAVSAIKKRMRTAEFMSSIPSKKLALIFSSLHYFLETRDYHTAIKVIRRLK